MFPDRRKTLLRITGGAGRVAPWLFCAAMVAGQAPAALQDTVGRLGDFDYTVRMEASRTIRRADPAVVAPILRDAAAGHSDSYVQFRSVVLLYGLEGERARSVFDDALDHSNDRVRAAAYEYFEQFPSAAVVPTLLAALDTETSEFVRPYLVRALAASDETAEVRRRLTRDIDQGQGYFRGAVIEALGDFRAVYAVDPLLRIAADEGPLRDDALLALGKIGDRRALDTLSRAQTQADERFQPVVSAAACLLGVDCENQVGYIIEALNYAAQSSDDQARELLRNATTGLGALASAGDRRALTALFEAGISAPDPARAPIAIALGTVAFRNPTVVREALHDASATGLPVDELLLLRDAFDLLDEDFAEERFYVLMRGDYWAADDDSTSQVLAERAIAILEF